ncbi:DinB family protein [Paenibacillus methanolicus]|uniref:DinB family protein n=1 Tax=Paenibacillus methanolicus TaxID=582686 RepID=A0A5S5BU99_9BACL|nr:DinB family protein [Paenibacillus methanolicus]TYP69782.1 DinB family protein [Paenibacillus methanolicus]
MASREQLLHDFAALIPFAESLRGLDEAAWTARVAPGKWAVRDIVSHMMLWDKYFLEEAIERIAQGEPLTARHLDYDAFNRDAMTFAATRSQKVILDLAIRFRSDIIRQLTMLGEERASRVYTDADGQPFAIGRYAADFIAHDAHHMAQIQRFLGREADGAIGSDLQQRT